MYLIDLFVLYFPVEGYAPLNLVVLRFPRLCLFV